MRVVLSVALATMGGAAVAEAQKPPACPAGATCPIYEVAITSTMIIRTAQQTTTTPTLSPTGTPVTLRQEHAGAVMTITGRGSFIARLGPGALQDADYQFATPPEGITARMVWSDVSVTGGPCTHRVEVSPPTDYNFWLGLSRSPVPRAALVASADGLELHQIISSKCEKGKGGGRNGMPIFSQAWMVAHGSGDDGDDGSAKSSAEAAEMLQGMDPARLMAMQAEMQKKLKGRDPSKLSESEMRELMTPDAAATMGQVGKNADEKLDAALDNFMIKIEGAGVRGGEQFADFTLLREDLPMPGGQGTVTERTRIRIAERPSGKALFLPDTVADEPDHPVEGAEKSSALKGALGAVGGTVGAAAGATLIDTLTGGAGKAVGARMGAGAAACPPGYVPAGGAQTTGTLVVDAARKGAKGKDAAAAPGQEAATQCVPAGGGGLTAEQMAAQHQTGAQGASGINPAMMTPVGAAVAAAPVAVEGGKVAVKGVKKLFGLNAKTWQEMLAEYGEKGQVELKGVRFIASTTELEEGGEEVIATAAEAIAKARYPVAIHVEPEAGKGEEPDPVLARQRREKLVAMLLAAGAPEAKFTAGAEVPEGLLPKQARVAKLGEARVFVVRVKDAP